MTIYVFGNPDIEFDSTPLRLLPELKRRFPQLKFEVKDPNEELETSEELTMIDTVDGIKRVQTFDGLENFSDHPHVSLHDFDLYSQLKYLQKLGKLKRIKIIGVPPKISEGEAIEEISVILRSNSL